MINEKLWQKKLSIWTANLEILCSQMLNTLLFKSLLQNEQLSCFFPFY